MNLFIKKEKNKPMIIKTSLTSRDMPKTEIKSNKDYRELSRH
jgi:hypothetical protein